MNNLSIVKTIRQFIGKDACTEVKMYCCKMMKKFFETLSSAEASEMGASLQYSSSGLNLHVSNRQYHKRHYNVPIGTFDETFGMKFCPFCGAGIEYIEEVKDETKNPAV